MTPNQPSWWLNIDQMLQNLQQTTPSPVEQVIDWLQSQTPVVQPTEVIVGEQPVPSFSVPSVVVQNQQSPVTTPSFSVESLDKSTTPIVSSWVVQPQHKKFSLPGWVRVLGSAFGTLLFLVFAVWFLSVQYPEEARTFWNGITGTFSTLAGVTEKNMDPDGMTVGESDATNTLDETHGVAGEYLLDSPLADAMDDASSQTTWPNQADQLMDSVFNSGISDTNAIDFTLTTWTQMTGTVVSGASWGSLPVSNYDPNFELPSSSSLPTVAEFQTQLLTLSEQAQTAMNSLIGNNDARLAKMRVVYKNSQSMIESLSTTNQVTQDMVEQYNTLQSLYNSVVQ